MKNSLPILIVFTLWVGATSIAVFPYFFVEHVFDSSLIKFIALISFLPLFVISFTTIAGLLSKVAQRGIVKGVFPRHALHPVYFLRRIYGGCWTQLFYFKPIYSIVLYIPIIKTLAFRLFGYRGATTNFTVYPDTWIRDLPMLNIGENTYLSNRATIGTNLCLSDGNILVDTVEIGKNSLIGHLAIIGPSLIGENTEVGVGAAMGIRVRLGNRVRISPKAGIGHGTKINDDTVIGQMSHIGTKVTIGKNIVIPAGANIPNGAVLLTQEDVNKYFSSETELLNQIRETMKISLANNVQDVS